MKGFSFLVFVFLTIFCWGVYGPVLHHGQSGMGAEGQLSLLRPIVGVGLAYFLIAVIFPVFILATRGEQGGWTINGFVWSFLAGAIGALGAVGIALANKFGGSPLYIMPLVFGFAPVVNTVVTMWMSKTLKEASTLFYIGVLIVALGGAGVLVFKPAPAPKPSITLNPSKVPGMTLTAAPLGLQQDTQENSPAAGQDPTAANNEPEESRSASAPAAEDAPAQSNQTSAPQTPSSGNPGDSSAGHSPAGASGSKGNRSIPLIICSIGLTALCWGAYGPVLHRGQMKMAGSRLRPFLCVGLAYFVLAVIVPGLLLQQMPEPGSWWNGGLFWSILAGAAGAFGALGIIYAFNFGGRPIFVMPLVFGGAPVVNTLTQTLTKGLGDVPPMFYFSLFMVIVGAILVLTNAPKGHAKPAPAPQPS